MASLPPFRKLLDPLRACRAIDRSGRGSQGEVHRGQARDSGFSPTASSIDFTVDATRRFEFTARLPRLIKSDELAGCRSPKCWKISRRIVGVHRRHNMAATWRPPAALRKLGGKAIAARALPQLTDELEDFPVGLHLAERDGYFAPLRVSGWGKCPLRYGSWKSDAQL